MSVIPEDSSKTNEQKPGPKPEPPQDNDYVIPEPDLNSVGPSRDTSGSQTQP